MTNIWDRVKLLPLYLFKSQGGCGYAQIKTDKVLWDLRLEYDELKERADKWDKAYGGVYDDEMPFTPERISLVMNFVNDHFPDFDTPKELEDMITEYTDWETELTEAEDKLKALKKYIDKWCEDCLKPRYTCPSCVWNIMKDILGGSGFTTKGDKDE